MNLHSGVSVLSAVLVFFFGPLPLKSLRAYGAHFYDSFIFFLVVNFLLMLPTSAALTLKTFALAVEDR